MSTHGGAAVKPYFRVISLPASGKIKTGLHPNADGRAKKADGPKPAVLFDKEANQHGVPAPRPFASEFASAVDFAEASEHVIRQRIKGSNSPIVRGPGSAFGEGADGGPKMLSIQRAITFTRIRDHGLVIPFGVEDRVLSGLIP